MLQLTDKEVRLILRRRTTWHKVLRRTWYAVSVLVVSFVLFVTAFMFLAAQKKLAYQNSIEAIQAVARTGTRPTFFIPAGQFAQNFVMNSTEESRLAAHYVDMFMKKSDSLGLTADKRLGMHLDITVAPCGLFGQRHSAGTMELFTSNCGCDTYSSVDKTVMHLDSTGVNVSVAASQQVTLANIQP